MRGIGLLLVLALTILGDGARAQDAMVVQTCGTLPQNYSPGATRLPTVDVNGNLCLSGAPIPATSNLTFQVSPATASPAGKDTNPCTTAAPCLTIQRAANVAAQYNYQSKYSPTINLANGTYNEQVTFPTLVNAPSGGSIVGNTSSPASVIVTDLGTGYGFTIPDGANWTVNGLRVAGTYGGFDAQPGGILEINNIDCGGAFTLKCIEVDANGVLFAVGATITVSASTMNTFIYSRGITVFDTASITFSNAVTIGVVVGVDSTAGFFAFAGGTFTHGSNVTATNGVLLSNGAFFETTSATKVDGSVLTRANFPGANASVDGWSTFEPDTQSQNAPSSGCAAIVDTFGVLRADYNCTSAATWTFNAASSGYVSAATTATIFAVTNTSTGGHPLAFLSVGSGGDLGMAAGDGGMLDATSGNVIYWWTTTGIFTLGNCLGMSAQGTFTANAADNSLCRLGAASFALGNGTAGDFSATLKLAHVTATALANSATTSAVCYNTGTGVLTYDGTIGTCTTSDERLKNIGPRIDDALTKLLKINGFRFTWKDEKYGKGPQIGVGAQTVEKVFPELVETGSDGIKSVAYEKLAAPIIEAMRELKGENDSLRSCLSSWHCRIFGF